MNITIKEGFQEFIYKELDFWSISFFCISLQLSFVSFVQYVIVVDDEDRENEGDLIMAASLVTPEAMAFIVRYGTGIVCVSMKEEDLERLKLPLMVTAKENEEKLCTAFTVSVVCCLENCSLYIRN